MIDSLSLKELKITTLNRCWKKIWPAVVKIENVHESGENEIGGTLDRDRSIGGEGFVDTAIEDVQEVGKAYLVEIAHKPQVNEIDSSSDEDNEVNNLTLKITGGIRLS